MPWVCFTGNFDWQPPNVRWMIAYRKGTTHLVKQEVADKAIRDGKAVAVERPKGRPDARRGSKD